MGQYYAVVNLDAKETISQFDFESGVKLTESCYVGNAFVDALSYLLENDWSGDRVFFCGDYAFESLLSPDYSGLSFAQFDNATSRYRDLLDVASDPYELARSDYRDRSTDFSTCRRQDFDGNRIEGSFAIDPGHYRFVVNRTEGVYYDREECPVSWVWRDDAGSYRFTRTDPLTIFLAVGNGLGGGDYHGPNEGLVGSWAGQAIAMSNEEPTGYRRISAPFDETKLFLTAPDEDLAHAVRIVAEQPLGGARGYASVPPLTAIKECIDGGFKASVQRGAEAVARAASQAQADEPSIAAEAADASKSATLNAQSDASTSKRRR